MSFFGRAEKRENTRLRRANTALRTHVKKVENFSRIVMRNHRRLAEQQAATFRVLAVQIEAARQMGEKADARAVADDLVEQLEIAGFGPQLELATHQYCREAGDAPC